MPVTTTANLKPRQNSVCYPKPELAMENPELMSSPDSTTSECITDQICSLAYFDHNPEGAMGEDRVTFRNSLRLPVTAASEFLPNAPFRTSSQASAEDTVSGDAMPTAHQDTDYCNNAFGGLSSTFTGSPSTTAEVPILVPYPPSQMFAYSALATIQQQLKYIEEQNCFIIQQNDEILKWRQKQLVFQPEFSDVEAYVALNHASSKSLVFQPPKSENMKRQTILQQGHETLQTRYIYTSTEKPVRSEGSSDPRTLKPYPSANHITQRLRPKLPVPSKRRKIPASSPQLQPTYTKDSTAPEMMLVGDNPNCQLPIIDYVRMVRLSRGDMNSVLLNLMDALIDPDVMCSATYSGTKDKSKEALVKNETFQAIVAQMRQQFGPWFNTKDLDFKRCVTNKCLNYARKRKALLAEQKVGYKTV